MTKSIDTEKTLDKIQHLFMTEAPKKPEETYLSIIKLYEKLHSQHDIE